MSETKPVWPVMSLAEARAALTAPGSPFEIETATIRGQPVRVWRHAPLTLGQVFETARGHGDRLFIVHEDDRVSFDAFVRATLIFAGALTDLGVRPGDRVAIAMRNLPEWPVSFFAAALVGAVATPLNAWWSGAELAYGLRDSGASVLVADAERLQRLAGRTGDCPDLKAVYVCRADAGTIGKPLEEVIGAPADWATLPLLDGTGVSLDPEQDATIFYTSGTSGLPKGVLGTHRNAGCSGMAGVYSLARDFVRRGDALPKPDPDAPGKVQLVSIPFFHTTGCNALLVPALMMGTTLVCQRRFDATEALGLIQRERVTGIGGVPAVAAQILQHPDRAGHDLSSLEMVSYGGAPAPSDLLRQIAGAAPGAMPGTGWGMTETSATHTHHFGADYAHRPDSCGPAAPVSDIRVVGPDGVDLPPGAVGELMAYGPNVVKGYWNRPEETAATFIDGWVRTGDLARIDDEGFCFIVDRIKDIVIRGGENIYCQEVEGILFEHPTVLDSAVIGRPHPVLGEEPVAVVQLAPGASGDEAALRAFVIERVAAFKAPAGVYFTTEPLPRNAAGKLLKAEIRDRFLRPARQGL